MTQSGTTTRRATMAPMASHPIARHLVRAKDLADARYAEPLTVADLAAVGGPVAGALQPGVPSRVRGEPARLPAHPAARAGRDDAADDRPHRRRHLHRRRAVQRRLVHHAPSPGCTACPRRRTARADRRPRRTPIMPACVVRAYGRPQNRTFREDAAPGLIPSVVSTTNDAGGNDVQDRQRAGVGARPGRGAGVLHPEARHGGPVGRHRAGDGGLPLAHRRPGRARTTSRSC